MLAFPESIDLSPEVIERHRRRAHELRAASVRQWFRQLCHALRHLVGAPGAGRPAAVG
ncbi:hypothetical protein [Desertibaculum subflavum]|uniref:hypothetical protein n=1 Tax=Desertibaculum subflavum TaxID=2268458 RepID=UPI0013C40A45